VCRCYRPYSILLAEPQKGVKADATRSLAGTSLS
jgi:hypothetical protein